jgi:V8-like Glu-specific endopeptidase
MQTKHGKVILSVFLIAMVALALGFSSQPAAAVTPPSSNTQGGAVTGITNTDDGVTVAASRPWTVAEMKAAIPYPMERQDSNSGGFSSDVTSGPNGPAGLVPGARPGGGVASAAASTFTDETLGVSPLGYGYPSPFTRFHVGAISAYTTYPFSTIGKLFFRQYGVSYVCSASVQGLRGIVTAGHCVHKGDGLSTGWSTNVVFVPAYRAGVAPFGQWSIPSLRTFTDWYLNGAKGDFDHDWGAGYTRQLINLKYLGQTVGYLGYAYNFSREQSWWLLGYPQAAPFNGLYLYACTTSYAYDSPFYSGGPAPMVAGCDQTGGTSGGPWIFRFGTGNYLNSVNSHRATVRPLELAGPYADLNTKTVIFDWARQ